VQLESSQDMVRALPIVDAALTRALPALQALGYAYGGSRLVNSAAFGDHIVGKFRSRRANRKIEIVLAMPSGVVPRLMASISNNVETIGVVDLLERRGHSVEAKAIDVIDSRLDLESQLTRSLSELERLLCAHTIDVVDGRAWEPAPFDWGDYK
jgi:hypothetical protein